jgi:two-component system sensor histidine kinase KdpD
VLEAAGAARHPPPRAPPESRDAGRLSPEEAREQCRREAGSGARGRLRVYLGMAPGVGKTYAMLHEARLRKARGTDVVIGYVETYGRPETEKAIGDLELVPRRKVAYRGVALEELDTAAVIRRAPDVALVDELAHTNMPGSKHEKRWQDVEELLDAGITVLSTVNIQHLESLKDLVEQITGVAVRETIPDRVLDEADEVELIDMAPNALRRRIRHGNVYPPNRAEQALAGFFREGNLTALRELALRRTAQEVDQQLERYMRGHAIAGPWPAALAAPPAPRLAARRRGPRAAGRGHRGARRLQPSPGPGAPPAAGGAPTDGGGPGRRERVGSATG